MPIITLGHNQQKISVADGANLMQSLLDAGMPVASSCSGEGVCGKCHMKILEGAQNLSKETDVELELREIHDTPRGHRISCQTSVLGDVTVTTTYW